MKDILIHFLDHHSLFKYELDSGSENQVRRALEDFFIHWKNKSLPSYYCSQCHNPHFMGYKCPIGQGNDGSKTNN